MEKLEISQKEHRFSKILLKYFLLLFVCLVLPIVGISTWYGQQIRNNLYEEIIRRNEASLEQAYENIDSVINSVKNLSYSISRCDEVNYLASIHNIGNDTTDNLEDLIKMISILRKSNEYINSVYIYFADSEKILENNIMVSYEDFKDKEILQIFSSDMSHKIQLYSYVKYNYYPYLISIICPIYLERSDTVGMVVVNVDVERLGDFLGNGKYRNKEYLPSLLIFDNKMERLVFSDEYRLYQEKEALEELKTVVENMQEQSSEIQQLWEKNYVISSAISEEDGLRCVYLTTTREFDERNQSIEGRFISVTMIMTSICLVLAYLLAKWVYRPIRSTVRVLKDMSMLTEWDRKDHLDEIEAIQRSILLAKQEKDYLNEQIQERIINLHNAQICALQSQINPHFMYNTLAAIGNSAGLLLGKDNIVTRMIHTLGKLLRTSLSGKDYLVPLSEELEHVELYVQLVEFRYHGRIHLYQEIPEELGKERIVKLTLQPLIENAIQHGLVSKRSGGCIWMRGKKEGNDIYLYVVDNGMGATEEKLQQLRNQLVESSISRSGHIGMSNVDQRLKLIFGEEYGLDVSNASEGGLCVTVHFRKI